jgi:phospholipid/cholesterol/gamma-HCH transport system substrate-binding protein
MNFKNYKEVLIGAFAVIILALLFFGFSYLQGRKLFSTSNQFVVVYPDAQGLKSSNPVLKNGLQIGSVVDITINPENPNQIIALIDVQGDIDVPKSAEAKIISSDLLGSKAVELTWTRGGKGASSGDTLVGAIEVSLTDKVSAEILPVKLKTEKMLGSLDLLIINLQKLFADESVTGGMGSVQRTLVHLENTSKTLDELLAAESSSLKKTMGHVESITANLQKSNQNISQITSNTATATEKLAKSDIDGMIKELKSTTANLNAILAQVNNGQGSLGALVKNKELYDNLNKTVADLDRVMADLYKNPKIYLGPIGKSGKKADRLRKK